MYKEFKMSFGTVKFKDNETYTLYLPFRNGEINIHPLGITVNTKVKGTQFLFITEAEIPLFLKDIYLCYPDFDPTNIITFFQLNYRKKIETYWKRTINTKYSYSDSIFCLYGCAPYILKSFSIKQIDNQERIIIKKIYKSYCDRIPEYLNNYVDEKIRPEYHSYCKTINENRSIIPFTVDKYTNQISTKRKLQKYGLISDKGSLRLNKNAKLILNIIFDKCISANFIYELLSLVSSPSKTKNKIYEIWVSLAKEKENLAIYQKENFRFMISKTKEDFILKKAENIKNLYNAHNNFYIISLQDKYLDYDLEKIKDLWYKYDLLTIQERRKTQEHIFTKDFYLIQFNKEIEKILSLSFKEKGVNYIFKILKYTLPSIKNEVLSFWNSLGIPQNTPEEISNIIEIPWEAVAFKDNMIHIYKYQNLRSLENNESFTRIISDFPVYKYPCPGILENYNWIKQAFANNLPKIKAIVDKDKNIKSICSEPIEISKIISILKSRNQDLLDYTITDGNTFPPLNTSFSKAFSISTERVNSLLRKYRSTHINFLINNSIKESKIIPCMEHRVNSSNETEEPAFIFTLKSTYKFYYEKTDNYKIIFENVYDNNASVVFDVKHENYNKALQAIYNFFQSDTINKRQKIHYKKIDKNVLFVESYYAVYHISKNEWIENLRI